MGQVNQPTNLVDQVKQLRRELAEVRKNSGLSSAILRGGGLSLLDSAFLKMVDSDGTVRLFVGGTTNPAMPDGTPQPIFVVNDHTGQNRIGVFDPLPDVDGYAPVVWIYDHLGRVAFTTDRNGGVAEPWISVPMYPLFQDAVFGSDAAGSHPTLPASALTSEANVWEGRIGKVSHPRIQFDVVVGRVTGVSATVTYRFYVGGTLLGSIVNPGYSAQLIGPFDITSKLGLSNLAVQVTAQAAGTGTDRLAMSMLGTWMRQT